MENRRRRRRRVLPAALLALTGVACGETATPAEPPQGDPEAGLEAAAEYGCAGCHVIPGLKGPNGAVAAPLTDFGERQYIAGRLPNNADNLTRWIQNPQEVDPGTAMPDLDVSRQKARDIAAYLLSLR